MGMYLLIAARNLLQSRRRSLLLSVALFLVTALLVVLMSLTRGLVETTVRSATTMLSGHVNVSGFYKTTASDLVPVVTDAPRLRAVIEQAVPDALVIDRTRGMAKIVGNSGSIMTFLAGIDPQRETRLRTLFKPAEEAAYKDGGSLERKGSIDDIGKRGTVVLFASQAKKLGIVPGDSITLTAASQRGVANSAELVVAAVAEDIGLLSSFAAFVSRDDVLALYDLRPDATGMFMLYLKDIERSEAVMGQLRETLSNAGYVLMDHSSQPSFHRFETASGEDWTGQKLDLTIWRDEVSFLDWIVTAFDTVSVLLVGILLVIIVIGIINTMWIAVRERTGEVGTLRAIGMRRSRVLAMFMTEALLLGFVATAAGGLCGGLLAMGLDAAQIRIKSDAVRMVLLSETLHLAPGIGFIVMAVLGFTAVTALSALWPALRAARMRPVTAIHHMG